MGTFEPQETKRTCLKIIIFILTLKHKHHRVNVKMLFTLECWKERTMIYNMYRTLQLVIIPFLFLYIFKEMNMMIFKNMDMPIYNAYY